MSLRTRVLGLFLLLAVLPLLVLGGVEYFRSIRALETLIATQNARLAARVAEAIETRGALLESDLLLLSENAETQRWLNARARGEAEDAAALAGRRFLGEAWSRLRSGYAGFQLLDSRGQLLYVAGGDDLGTDAVPGTLDPVERPVRDLASGHPIGAVRLALLLESMVPVDLLDTGFGDAGYGMILDRPTGRVLYHPSTGVLSRPVADVFGPGFEPARLEARQGRFRYQVNDTSRVASYAGTTALPWVVVVSGALDEFAVPFIQLGRWTLLLFGAVALLATIAFGLMLRRTTRSLEELTAAAGVVGQGDFAPQLPPARSDEVGRLSASFGLMVTRVRDMMDEVRTSRQLAVLGEFAAQLAHEIRNPLTSIKLNLQKIDREVHAGAVVETAAVPLGIALREVGRLDQVVRGVLDLTRQEAGTREVRPLHDVVRESLEIVADQAQVQGVRIAAALDAGDDLVSMTPARLKGAVLNLLLNALEAMPDGGVLTVASQSDGGAIDVIVSDTGPGISAEQRSTIFRPFTTSKQGGTGLGLPLARRTLEEHGGTLAAEDSPAGARFVLRLPLATS